jgi:thiol-disulfide isomerase/thioredoxin
MRTASATLLLLLSTACQQQPDTNATRGNEVAAAPAPGDPEFIAEDPRLTQLAGQPGPAIELQLVGGGKLDLKKLYGSKPVYLKLWATYCIPCRAQMPGFEAIYQKYHDRMEVIAVNAGVGDDAAKVKAFAEKSGMHMPVAIDDGSLGAWIKLQETPLHIIIGRDGRVQYAGHQDGPQLDAAIQKAMAAGPGGPIATTAVATIPAINPGDIVPRLVLRDSGGRPVELPSGSRGRPRAILFTSIWCESYLKDTEPESVPNCRRARETVDRLAKTGDIEWLGVMSHLWTDPKSLASYETETKAQIPLVVDSEGTAFRTFGIQRFPAIALIDRDGRLAKVLGPGDVNIAAAVADLQRAK